MPDTSPDLPAMSPLAVYRQAVEQRGFAPDEAQRRAAEALERCFQALHEAHRHGAIQGVYLWGPVGRGKTWLMDHFYQCLRVPARRQHFHHFMQWVHQRQFELTGTADPLRALARELARDVRVLCFDELFVSDIGDAILLGSLLRIMFEEGVVLVATSNQPPEQLYADGFNRERFLPAIEAIQRHMAVVAVDGGQDHRLHPGRAELDATVDGSLFRLGHSTLLLKLAGSWWLTDPVFSERASPLPFAGPKRFHAPPVALADLPPIRGVILSHDHYDHLDRAAIKALVPLVELFLAPLGVGDRLLAWGVPPGKVRQLDWWQGIEAGGLRLTATPAQHFSGRGLHDGNRTLWCSWVIESAELKLFFSGDSGYFDGFAEIGRRYGPFDLTMLETGAYNEHWPYVHMHPQQTLQAHRDLGGRWLLPIHNGTFDLAMHAWYEPFERILELATEHGVRVSTPMMGERIDLQAPHAGRRWWREVVDSETQVQGYGCCRS